MQLLKAPILAITEVEFLGQGLRLLQDEEQTEANLIPNSLHLPSSLQPFPDHVKERKHTRSDEDELKSVELS